jgi:RHS repeat-associated protein
LSATDDEGTPTRWAGLNDGNRQYGAAPEWQLPLDIFLQRLDTIGLSNYEYVSHLSLKSSKDLGVRLADVNGDGRVDVLQGVEGGAHATWINDADVNEGSAPSPWVSTTNWQLPSGTSFVGADGKDKGLRLVDLDGDGMADILSSRGGTNEVWLNDGEIPDLLTTVTNPLGGTTTIQYDVSTSYNNSGGDGVPDLPQIMPVVQSITRNPLIAAAGASPVSIMTSYAYSGGLFDAAAREFRGFEEVVTTTGDSRIEKHFHQEEARAGLPKSERLTDLAGSACYVETQYSYTGDSAAPWVALPKDVVRWDYDGRACTAPPVLRRTKTTYHYGAGDADPYGNVSEIVSYGEVDAVGADLDPADNRRVFIEYAPANTALYLAGLVCRESLFEGGGSGTLVKRAQTAYGTASSCVVSSKTTPTRLVEMKSASTDGPTTILGYDAYGNVTSMTDPRGFTSTFEYDGTLHAFVTSETTPPVAGAPGGLQKRYAYTPAGESCPSSNYPLPSGAGLPYRVTDANGGETRRCYDGFGRVVREVAPGSTGQTDITYFDSAFPRRTETSSSIDASTSRLTITRYDGLGRAYEMDQDGPATIAGVARAIRVARTYDTKGRLATQSDPRFTTDTALVTTFGYDPLDRPTSTLLPSIAGSPRQTTVQYSLLQTAPGPVVERIRTCDPNGNRVDRDVNAFGDMVKVHEFEGVDPCTATSGLTARSTTYTYAASGALKNVIDASGNVTAITYADLLGLDRTLVDPDTGSTSFVHDAAGNVSSRTDAAGTTTWTYDALNRPLARRINGTFDAGWTYDTATLGAGLLAHRVDASGVYRVDAYDAAARPLEESRSLGGATLGFTNTFDRLGQLRSRTYPTERRIEWRYDSKGYLRDIQDPTENAPTGVTYASLLDWDALLRLKQFMSGNAYRTVRTFEPATNRLATLELRNNAGTPVERWQYGYDNGDRITSITDLQNASRNRSFDYDQRDRLTSATHFGPAPSGSSFTASYGYDGIGNLLCLVEVPGQTACNGAGVNLSYPTSAQPNPHHAPATVAPSTVTYSATKNITSWQGALPGGGDVFSYDALGRLASFTHNYGTSVHYATYVYNADGLRVTTTEYLGRKTVRHIVSEDFEWDQTRKLAHVHVMMRGEAIATITTPWSGPPAAATSWLSAPRIDGPTLMSLLFAASALLVALQLASLRRRGLPIARPAVASATLAFFLAGAMVPHGAWAVLTDGDVDLDGKLTAADVALAMRIASGEILASSAQNDHGDVAPLGSAPENPMKIDAGDVALLVRGASGEDVDLDGLGTEEEFSAGSSPFKLDTDGDGLADGFELAAGIDPADTDTDNDGTLDGNEDSDGDGLTNAQERNIGTDPAFSDTDGDGLPDNTDPAATSAKVFQLRDHLGSVVLVVRDNTGINGGIARHSRYSAFGGKDFNTQPAPSSPAYIGTFGFTGQRYEQWSGTYDYKARWYEPELGKFLQADSIVPAVFDPQSHNRYSYVANDPVNRIDPSGHEPMYEVMGGDLVCGSPIPIDSGSDGPAYNPDIGPPGFGSHGPGSLDGLIHPMDPGGQAARPLTPQELIAQFWAPIYEAFGNIGGDSGTGVQYAAGGWGGRMSGAQPFPGSVTPNHDGRGGPDDLLGFVLNTADQIRFIRESQRLDIEIDELRIYVRQNGMYSDQEAYVWKSFRYAVGVEHVRFVSGGLVGPFFDTREPVILSDPGTDFRNVGPYPIHYRPPVIRPR